ncbi:MAG: four-helix bundle copper-binding protein [Pseudomonadota bacterium]
MDAPRYDSCIEACQACAIACDHCLAECLRETDVQAMARCIALDIDCAETCRLAAAFMARGSELAAYLCKFCEEICEACGEECAKHPQAHCQDCARACQRCAVECRRMAVKMPGASATGARPGAAH